MKAISVLCILLGIVLLVAGIGVRIAVDSNDDIQEANEMLEMFVGEKLNPQMVSKLLNGKLYVMGSPITLRDVLQSMNSSDAAQAETLLTLYANSTWLALGGAGLLIIGIVLKRRSSYAY